MKQGIPELGDFGGLGLGRTTATVLRQKKYEDDPHAVCTVLFQTLKPSFGIYKVWERLWDIGIVKIGRNEYIRMFYTMHTGNNSVFGIFWECHIQICVVYDTIV